MTRTTKQGDKGSAVVESLILSVLTILPIAYAVVALGSIQRDAIAVSTAAREAGRAFVTAPNGTTASSKATSVAKAVLVDNGLDAGASQVTVLGNLTRGEGVSVTVAYSVHAFDVPLLGSFGPVTLSSTHFEVVDRHRSVGG